MRKDYFRIPFVLLLLMLPCSANALEDRISDALRKSVDEAIAAVKPALVRIRVVEADYSEGREVKSESAGSGVIFTREGHVITNHHVAGNSKRLVCTLANKEEIEAELVGTDPLSDIAVIKLRPQTPREFPFAEFGDSDKIAVGDTVLAMGSPLALSQSVTLGIVSNTEMVMPELFWPFNTMTMDGEDVGSMVRWIGHDAPIYGGNSGGPLVSLDGKIVGINEIRLGLSGAIPGNLAKDVANQIIKNGKVRRSWIGLQVQPLLKTSGLQDGVLVSGTFSGSPAEKAGLKPGDVILKFAGKDVRVRFDEQLPLFNQMMAALPIGEEVEIVLLRDGKQQTVRVKTEERQETKPKEREFTEWGICGSNISLLQAKEMSRPNQDGLLVCSVRPGGPADQAKPQIRQKDIIVEVAGKPIKNAVDFAKVTEEITRGKDEPVPTLVGFDRDQEHYLTVVRVGVQKLEDPGLEVRKAWLPIASQVITRDLAEALGIGERTGVRVTRVYPGSTAEKAGLKVGDLILAIDDQPIPASQPEDTEVLPTMIRQYKVNSSAVLTVLRDNKEQKIPVVLPPSPKLAREMKKYRDTNFEFTVRDVTFIDRTRQNWEDQVTGAYVEAVSEGGWAALGRLAVGDLVQAVDGKPVRDMESMKTIMEEIAQKKPKTVVFHVRRGIHQLFVELQPSWPDQK